MTTEKSGDGWSRGWFNTMFTDRTFNIPQREWNTKVEKDPTVNGTGAGSEKAKERASGDGWTPDWHPSPLPFFRFPLTAWGGVRGGGG